MKFYNSKPNGQALLFIMVVSTIGLMLLLGLATRINLGRENTRRTAGFDTSVAANENAFNSVVNSLQNKTTDCRGIDTLDEDDYKKITDCTILNSLEKDGIEVELYGKKTEGFVNVGVNNSIALNLGSADAASGVPLSGVNIECVNGGSNNPQIKLLVTLIYTINDNEYKTIKGISNCDLLNDVANKKQNNVTLYDNSATVKVTSGPTTALIDSGSNAKFKTVKVRLMDGSPQGDIDVKINALSCDAVTCDIVSATESFSFLVAGTGGLGSDSIMKFELPRGNTTLSSPALDFVYFGSEN